MPAQHCSQLKLRVLNRMVHLVGKPKGPLSCNHQKLPRMYMVCVKLRKPTANPPPPNKKGDPQNKNNTQKKRDAYIPGMRSPASPHAASPGGLALSRWRPAKGFQRGHRLWEQWVLIKIGIGFGCQKKTEKIPLHWAFRFQYKPALGFEEKY